MARNLYGCTSADYAMTDDGQQVAGAVRDALRPGVFGE